MIDIKNTKLLGMTVVSALVSLMLLHRWVVTAAKQKSFGRLWQYYNSWFDFGFHRRGLVGTLLTESGLNKIFNTPYQFAYFFYSSLILLSYVLLLKVIAANEKLSGNTLFVFALLFSPAIFFHFGYSNGCNDILLFILFLTAIFYIRNAFGLSLIVISGILVHELFVFFLPCIFFLTYLKDWNKNRTNWVFFSPIIAALITVMVVAIYGKLNTDIVTYEARMAELIPQEAYQHTLWSGYFELSSTVENNVITKAVLMDLWHNGGYLFIPTFYALFIAYVVAFYSTLSKNLKLITVAVILFPLSTQLIASDYYRWVSISACLGFVTAMVLITKELLILPRWVTIFLTLFVIFSPFGVGSDFARPFPVHQFILEKVFAR